MAQTSMPIRRPDIRPSASAGRIVPTRPRARVENSQAANAPGAAADSVTASANAPSSGSVSPPTEWRRMDCSLRSANNSPVMKVRKPTTRSRPSVAHFVWVPGKQAVPEKPGSSASRPASWVSWPLIQFDRDVQRLLAAHDVRRVELGHAVDDRHGDARIGRRDAGEPGGSERLRRHANIGRLRPALARADHAAGDDRHGAAVGEPAAHRFEQRRLEFPSLQRAHAERPCCDVEYAVAGHRPGAQVGGAPVDADPLDGFHSSSPRSRRAHRQSSNASTTLRRPSMKASATWTSGARSTSLAPRPISLAKRL